MSSILVLPFNLNNRPKSQPSLQSSATLKTNFLDSKSYPKTTFLAPQKRDPRALPRVSSPINYQTSAMVSFGGRTPNLTGARKLPKVAVKTPKKEDPRDLPGVPYDMAKFVISFANERGISIGAALKLFINPNIYTPKVLPEASKSARIGNCKVTTLIDGGQIFNAYKSAIKWSDDFMQNSMFEFQNLKVDAHKWPTNGAEVVPGSKEQQEILGLITAKTKGASGYRAQQILDVHKWYINGHGKRERHYNNQDMVRYMKTNGIDVVPAPRSNQGGSNLDHIKVLIVGKKDGSKKAVVSGMNMGTHSAANHDVGFMIESLPGAKNSEVDNLIDMFNQNWKFAWERVASTEVIKGPLTKEEQKFYTGLDKEIKPENVEYMEIVGKLYDNPYDKNRYYDGALPLIPCNPVEDPKIKVLRNSPREMAIIGAKGEESIRREFMHNLRTSKEYVGLNFVFTDKEAVETIIKRWKKPQEDPQHMDTLLVVESGILKDFPYCRKAYNRLKRAGVPIIIFKSDKETNQRMHAKLNIFDKTRILSGSFNVSAMGMNHNLKKGKRDDYDLYSERIYQEVKEHLKDAKYHEEKLGISPLLNKPLNYEEIKERISLVGKAADGVKKNGSATLMLDGKKHHFTQEHDAELSTVHGYYIIAKERYNAREAYKRGNNELAVAFESPSLAKVFLKQIDKDYKYSESKFDKLKNRVFSMEDTQGEAFDDLLLRPPVIPEKSPAPKIRFIDGVIKKVTGKEHQGRGLYTADGKWLDFNKVGDALEDIDITKASDNEVYAYWHANALRETQSTWVRRYNKYNMDKMLATYPTLNSEEAHIRFGDNLEALWDKKRNKSLDVPITKQVVDENGNVTDKLCLDCTVFDTETTGLNIFGEKLKKNGKPLDRIVQIGAIQIKDGEVVKESAYNQLINPGMAIPEEASGVHGITDDMVKDKPHIEGILPSFLNDYLNKKNGAIVAYNAKYDITLLNNSIRRHNTFSSDNLKERHDHKVLDPFILVQRLHPYLGARKKLGEQYRFLFSKNMENAHDAFADVKGTVDVLKYCLYNLSEHRVDKSKPLTLREVLIFQNGGRVKNLNMPLDMEDCNDRVNYDKSYRRISLPVINYFKGYKLRGKILDSLKSEIGEENYKKLKKEKVVDTLYDLHNSSGLPINPAETQKAPTKSGFENSFYVMEKNFKKVLGFAELEGHNGKTKEEIEDLILQNSKQYINKKSIPIWIKNTNPYDIKDGNDLPDLDIARKVMAESKASDEA